MLHCDEVLEQVQSCSFEDRLSTASSLSEAEEKTIRAVCEQMKVSNVNFLVISV